MKNLWKGREVKALMVEKESYHYINGLDVRIAYGADNDVPKPYWRWSIARQGLTIADGAFFADGINVENKIIELARELSIERK
jgi:hypothetical protein